MTSHTSPHILTLPKDLTHKDLLLMDRTISSLSLTDRTLIISLNEPIDHSIWADEHCKFYSSQFLRYTELFTQESTVDKDQFPVEGGGDNHSGNPEIAHSFIEGGDD